MWTEKRLKDLQERGLIKGYTQPEKGKEGDLLKPQAKKHKYGATRTEVDGISFDSIKEANRYKELKMLLKAGHIAYLEMQVPYELNPGGTHSIKYIADFEYLDAGTGAKITEDVKGYRTSEYKKKRRLMKKVHGITIKEI